MTWNGGVRLEINKNKDGNVNFVNTAFFDDIVNRTIRYMKAGYPVHFVGPSGVGKTSLAIQVAKQFNRPVTVIRGHHEMRNKDLLGQYVGINKKEVIDNYIHSVYKMEQEVNPVWESGALVEAVKKGHVLIYDEFTRSKPETNNIFLSLLEERILPLYGKGKETKVGCHKDFRILFTSNPDEYAGTFHTQDALMDRLITIRVDLCEEEGEMEILMKKTNVSKKEAAEVVRLMSTLRMYGRGSSPSLRVSLMIANIAKRTHIPIDCHDKEYQALCLDVLSQHVKKLLPNLDQMEIQELILQEMIRKGERE
jgi:nitric oxide reductase NorQ protein